MLKNSLFHYFIENKLFINNKSRFLFGDSSNALEERRMFLDNKGVQQDRLLFKLETLSIRDPSLNLLKTLSLTYWKQHVVQVVCLSWINI